VAIIGLGTGSLACYAKPGQPVTFYEIDPTVLKIARDARLFTFLRDCSPSTTVVLGDGRLSIAAAADKSYRLVIVDAFSSDAIPMHLLNREAIALYMAKLTDDGILGLHISNRYLDLGPVVAALARDLELVAYERDDFEIGVADEARGRVGSQWAVVARRSSALSQLVSDARWRRLVADASVRAWTDDFSNIVTRLRWR
jgi:spermidine synthase